MKAVLKFLARLALLGALNLDLVVLRAAKWCVDVAEEWLSLSQRSIERGLMVASLAGYVVIAWHSWWLLAFPLFVTGSWARHRKPAALRGAEICSTRSIITRLCGVCYATPIFAMCLLCGLRWWMAPVLTFLACYVPFEYVTALPGGGDRKGRKRKLALARLKAMFGTSWIPLPQGHCMQRAAFAERRLP